MLGVPKNKVILLPHSDAWAEGYGDVKGHIKNMQKRMKH